MPTADAVAWLYLNSELAVVVHDTQPDPCFIYANIAAQRCFERPWAELVGMPSRLCKNVVDLDLDVSRDPSPPARRGRRAGGPAAHAAQPIA